VKSRIFLRRFGTLIKLLALVLLFPGAVAAYYGETRGVIAFAITSFLALAAGIVFERLGSEEQMGYKEGFAW
jgi:Trk-type K+ transport system membrane component